MENEPIEVVVEPTFAEYRRILCERAAETVKNNRLAIGVELTAVIIWTLNTFLLPDFDGPIHRTILWVLVAVLVLNVLIYAALMYGIRSQARKWVGTGEPITYTFDLKGLKSTTRLVSFESSWDRFTKVSETESDLLFILENSDFIPIPKRFVSEQTRLVHLRRLIDKCATGSVELLS